MLSDKAMSRRKQNEFTKNTSETSNYIKNKNQKLDVIFKLRAKYELQKLKAYDDAKNIILNK